MDDFFDYFSDDEDEFVSDGNVYDNEEDDYENHLYGGEEDGGDEEEFQDEEEVEEDLEDEMEDYDEEEVMEYGEQPEEEHIVVDQDGIEILDEIDEDLVDFEDEEEDEEVEEDAMFDEEVQDQLFEDEEEEEQLLEDDEGEYEGDDVYGNEDFYEDQTDSEDEFAVAPPVYFPRPTVLGPFPVIRIRPRSLHLEGESSDLSGDERGVGGFGRNWREGGDGTATSRPTENNSNASDGNVVASKGAGSSNDSSWNGFQGPICPICYENWTGEGQHCVCCLPCGHLYGLSCITIWLQRPNSQKCPQCNDECELEDVRRLYGMQLPTTGVEELQKKLKSLEAKCASLELKDADWLIKEAEWKKKEADLKQQLNQHKEAEAGVAKDIVIQAGANERRDPIENPEPSNALSQMKL